MLKHQTSFLFRGDSLSSSHFFTHSLSHSLSHSVTFSQIRPFIQSFQRNTISITPYHIYHSTPFHLIPTHTIPSHPTTDQTTIPPYLVITSYTDPYNNLQSDMGCYVLLYTIHQLQNLTHLSDLFHTVIPSIPDFRTLTLTHNGWEGSLR